jgi:hypothetical protein
MTPLVLQSRRKNGRAGLHAHSAKLFSLSQMA